MKKSAWILGKTQIVKLAIVSLNVLFVIACLGVFWEGKLLIIIPIVLIFIVQPLVNITCAITLCSAPNPYHRTLIYSAAVSLILGLAGLASIILLLGLFL